MEKMKDYKMKQLKKILLNNFKGNINKYDENEFINNYETIILKY